MKDISDLKRLMKDRKIEVTDQTAKIIAQATNLDEDKVKKIMEYWDLSDNDSNKDFTNEEVVQVCQINTFKLIQFIFS